MDEWGCYEAGADLYAAAGEDDPAWRQKHRLHFSRGLQGSLIADLGCGPGYDLAAFNALGLQTIGVDGSAAMLKIAAINSPLSRLMHQDLRHCLPHHVDGLWSMFALLHIPDSDLAICFNAWRQSIAKGGLMTLGLVESDLLPMREVSGWLSQPVSAVFYYHSLQRVQELLSMTGYSTVSAEYDTPKCYRGGVYDEFKLRAYVIRARAE